MESLWPRVRARLSLRDGMDAQGTIQRVSLGASLTVEHIWLLLCSAILASIGLDTSSTAVVIGAMLISPLMGPILGVGLGMGVTDRHLLQRSLRELGVSTLLSLGASTLYFLVSPLAAATPELVARTRPTLLDVGVAFFGGLAGIIAGSRRNISLALPGVAIATALMPPLCTAGFGLATGNWSFFLGAFYLYALNAIFIALATFMVVRLLRFPRHVQATPRERQIELRVVLGVAFVATVPSMYFLYATAHELRENRRITSFVRNEIEQPGRAVPQWERRNTAGEERLRLYIAGLPVHSEDVDSLQSTLRRYDLPEMKLELVQSDISAEDLTRMEGAVQRDILQAVTAATSARDSAVASRVRQDSTNLLRLASELNSVFPEIQGITYAPRLDLLASDSSANRGVFLITFDPRTSRITRNQIVRRAQALVSSRLPAPVSVQER